MENIPSLSNLNEEIDINTIYYELLKSKLENEDLNHHSTPKLTPTALLNKSEIEQLPIIKWEALGLSSQPQLYNLILRPMHAGIGSNLKREKYIKKYPFSKNQNTVINAKGIDLKIPGRFLHLDSQNELFPLAYIHLYRAQKLLELNKFKEITIENCTGLETRQSMEELWKFFYSYNVNCKIIKGKEILQTPIPTIPATHKAPGGHGIFAIYSLYDLLFNKTYDSKEDTFIIISNGEDISAFPDIKMLDYMKNNKIPMAMVVTDKTQDDLKGGLLAIYKKNHHTLFQIYELAQAQADNKVEWFEQMGLSIGKSKGLFNTNMFILQASLMRKILLEDSKDFSFYQWCKQFHFDIIKNKKKAISQEYIQLESALASIFMGIDSYFLQKYNHRMMYYIHIPQDHRNQFFTPIKTALDFYQLFYSKDFIWDESLLKLKRISHSFNIKEEQKKLKDKNIVDLLDIIQEYTINF